MRTKVDPEKHFYFSEVIALGGERSIVASMPFPREEFEYAYGVDGDDPAAPRGLQDEIHTCVVVAGGEKHYVRDTVAEIGERHGLPFLSGEVYGTYRPFFTSSGVVVRRRGVRIRQRRGERGRTVTIVTISQCYERGACGATDVVFLGTGRLHNAV